MTQANTSTAEDCDRQKNGIQVIARMGTILRALSAHPLGLSLGEIATTVGLPRSTVQRIVTAGVQEGILEPVETGSGFRLGPALGQFLCQIQADVISIVRPHLDRLSSDLSETTCFTRLNGHRVSVVDMVIANQIMRIVPTMGGSAPIHIAADGKAFLARMSDDDVRRLFGNDLPQDGRHPQSVAELLVELAEIRRTKIAFDHEGFMEGLSAAAVTIDTCRGTYAISVPTFSWRLRDKKSAITTALLHTKSELEKQLGTTTTSMDSKIIGMVKQPR